MTGSASNPTIWQDHLLDFILHFVSLRMLRLILSSLTYLRVRLMFICEEFHNFHVLVELFNVLMVFNFLEEALNCDYA